MLRGRAGLDLPFTEHDLPHWTCPRQHSGLASGATLRATAAGRSQIQGGP